MKGVHYMLICFSHTFRCVKKQGAQGALILDATIFALIRASSYGDAARIRAVLATGCIERSPQDKRSAERPDFPHVRRGV
jgi:hypothetical protein